MDMHIDRLVEPEEIARVIGHRAENDEANATTLEVTGGFCQFVGTAKQKKCFRETEQNVLL